jgi:hypothetical protein
VVAERSAGPTVRPLRGEPLGDDAVVGDLFGREPVVGTGEAGAVREQLPRSQPLLARGGELRPVVADPLVEENTPVSESPVTFGAGPQVDDTLTVDVRDELGGVVTAFVGRDGGELRADGFPQ